MTMFLTIAVIALIFVVVFQIAKASEYVSVIKGEEESRKQNNKINAFLMLGFMIMGLIGCWYCNELYYGKTLLPHKAASNHGVKVDEMLWVTLWVTGVVFIATQIILFWFAFKYQEKENRKVFYFAHSNKLEALWTVVPAIFLTVLVVIGLRNWYSFTGDAPQGAMQVEVTGKQFGWIFRYPGSDKEFGKKYYRNIDATNSLGIIWNDTAIRRPNGDLQQLKDDKFGHDDIVLEGTMYLIKDKPVKLIIGSRDVIHDVGLSHFRLKMDAVPGTPTTLWFTPTITTEEMKKETNNPNFQYELSCDQMCGNGHYSMKAIVEVVTQAEFDKIMSTKKPAYYSAFPSKAPVVAADTTKPMAAVVDKTSGIKK
jgi:cytochrome c oxidase subunit II